MRSKSCSKLACIALLALLFSAVEERTACGQPRAVPERPAWVPEGYDDAKQMREQLGIQKLRPGKDGQSKNDEATANQWLSSLPDALAMKDGTRVASVDDWVKRRAEIVEDFAREVYGRIPQNTPDVSWQCSDATAGEVDSVPILSYDLSGKVENQAFPQIEVTIRANFTIPAKATQSMPILIEFGRVSNPVGGPDRGGPAFPRGDSWHKLAIEHGWAYGTIEPNSVQADRGGFALRQGIIGLCNQGEPRKPDDWGALRAWQWGVSRLIDFFAAHPEYHIDPTKVGIEGVSRYGKAALVTQAFDTRVAVAFVASSGEGGVKLHRRDFGEAVENLTGGGYYWMAGNFMKYGAAEATFGSKTAVDLPVDSHELIALCAPRPCFISYGIPKPKIGGGIGDPDWVDAHGSYMAGVMAGPVYRLLGKQGFGNPETFLTDEMPPVTALVGRELAWRQHEGGHTAGPNFATFFAWINEFIPSTEIASQDNGEGK